MRYIIIEKKLGVFVGQLEYYAVYAKNEFFGAEKVVSFDTKKEAKEFVEEVLNYEDKEFYIAEIDSKFKYISVKEIIKAGYGKHTHRMLDNIPMISETIH